MIVMGPHPGAEPSMAKDRADKELTNESRVPLGEHGEEALA
jgi:hypothetical protein